VPNCIRFRVQGLGIRVQGFIEAKKRTLPKLYMQQGYRRGQCPDCSQSLARQSRKCNHGILRVYKPLLDSCKLDLRVVVSSYHQMMRNGGVRKAPNSAARRPPAPTRTFFFWEGTIRTIRRVIRNLTRFAGFASDSSTPICELTIPGFFTYDPTEESRHVHGQRRDVRHLLVPNSRLPR